MTTDSSDQTRLVAKEAGGTWLAQVVSMGLRYVTMLCTTHVLGTALFGVYTLSITLTSIASTVAVLGLAQGALPFLSKARKSGIKKETLAVVRAALLLVTFASILLATLNFIAAPWFADSVFTKPELSGFLVPFSSLIVITALTMIILSLLQGFMAVKERAWIEGVLVVGMTGLGMALTWWLDLGAKGTIVSVLAGALSGLLAGAFLLSRKAPGSFVPSQSSAPLPLIPMLSYSWPLLGTTMLSFLLAWSDILIIGVFCDSKDVGVYGVCARLAPAIIMFHESLRPVFLSRLSDLYAEKDTHGIHHLFQLTARWAMWPGLIILWVLLLWGTEILSLFGTEFKTGVHVLTVLCIGKAIIACTGMSGLIFGVTNRAKVNLFNMVLLVGGNIVLNLILIPRYGVIGAAIATTTSYILVRTLQAVQIWYIYGILAWNLKSLIPLIGISALAFAFYPLRGGLPFAWGWVFPMVLFLLVCFCLFLFKGLTEDDRTVWRAMTGKLRKLDP